MLKFPSKHIILLSFFVFILLYFTLYFLFEEHTLLLPILLLTLFVTLLITSLYIAKTLHHRSAQIERKNVQHYYQTEALLTINKLADIQHPIAKTRGWAGSPDFIKIIFEAVLKHKPNLILELGSGVSTLYTGNLIKSKQLNSRILSLDHEPTFAKVTRENCDLHKIQSIASIQDCTIKTHHINGKEWLWYDTENISLEAQSVGILVVDGPPTFLQKQSRYPALPILLPYLKNEAIIIVDDYSRADDFQVIERWCKEFSEVKLLQELKDSDKGTAILQIVR